MGVIQKQLTSSSGFRSPGFSVDGNGDFTIANLNTTTSLSINNVPVLTATTLGSSVTSSSLTSLGTLTNLHVNSSNDVTVETTADINLTSNVFSTNSSSVSIDTSGAITLTSGQTGSINNINIGETSPGTGNFTTITATDNVYIGTQNIKAYSAAIAVALS